MSVVSNYGIISTKDDWETPQVMFNELNREFNFDLDPASNEFNAKCERYFTEEDSGLLNEWIAEAVFVNPPYSEVDEWVKKCYYEWKTGNAKTVVMLVFAKTETKWFHKYILPHAEIRFIKGRVKFELRGIPKDPAPFGSMIVIWKDNQKKMKNLKAYFQENDKNESIDSL